MEHRGNNDNTQQQDEPQSLEELLSMLTNQQCQGMLDAWNRNARPLMVFEVPDSNADISSQAVDDPLADPLAIVWSMSNEVKIYYVLGVGKYPTTIGLSNMEIIGLTPQELPNRTLDGILDYLIPTSLSDQKDTASPIVNVLRSHKPEDQDDEAFYTDSVQAMLRANFTLQFPKIVSGGDQAIDLLAGTDAMLHCLNFRAKVKQHNMPEREENFSNKNVSSLSDNFLFEECKLALLTFYERDAGGGGLSKPFLKEEAGPYAWQLVDLIKEKTQSTPQDILDFTSSIYSAPEIWSNRSSI